MTRTDHTTSESSTQANRPLPEAAESNVGLPGASVRETVPHQSPAPPTSAIATVSPTEESITNPLPPRRRKWMLLAGVIFALVVGGYFLVPWVYTAMNSVSTDDAYVNG